MGALADTVGQRHAENPDRHADDEAMEGRESAKRRCHQDCFPINRLSDILDGSKYLADVSG
jgi:hypothetical protein